MDFMRSVIKKHSVRKFNPAEHPTIFGPRGFSLTTFKKIR